MKVESTRLPEVKRIVCRVLRDDRGQFSESWRHTAYAAEGIGPFVQDNVSVSKQGVLRGLHLQHPKGQGKLVSALRGRIFDVAVDVRIGSPTFGQWVGEELSADNGTQLYIPVGFAHGFVTLSDDVVVGYKCTDYYSPADERSVLWNDPQIAIDWPVVEPIVSGKDAAAPTLAATAPALLPVFGATSG